jgi:hypothetical protein
VDGTQDEPAKTEAAQAVEKVLREKFSERKFLNDRKGLT